MFGLGFGVRGWGAGVGWRFGAILGLRLWGFGNFKAPVIGGSSGGMFPLIPDSR